MPELTDLEKAVLMFERENHWWEHEGNRERVIGERFGLSRINYDLLLIRIIRRPEALAYDAQTVRRLRRKVQRNRVTRA